MSIKYLQDQQLNQVQQSPNNSPWAKLIAQSEMLERNKMRQPQGQAPQGTVAGNIQQQLMATQQQEGERENADLYKSQMLAQLIGSGQIPADFMSSSQGYADGGLTGTTMQPGTGAYRGIMVPSQTTNPMGMQPQTAYRPPNSQDPAAQEKKHGLIQSMLDDSIVGMFNGRGNINNAMQDYADLFTGKMFSRGFAEGGDIRGFAGGGGLEKFLNRYPKHPSTVAINPYLQAPPGVQYQDVPELQKVLGGAKINNELAELLRQDPSALDKVKTYFGKQPKGLPYIPQISESPELQEYYKSLYEPKTRGDVYNSLAQQANAPTPSASGVEQMKIPPRGSMPPQEQPNVGPRVDPTAEFKSRMYGEQSGISPARSNLMGTLFNVAEQKEAVNPARSNLMGTLLNVAEQKEAQVNPARSNLMGTLLNVAEQKEALANQPKPSMTERLREAGMAGYNDKTILDTMANKMSATDRINAANKPDIPVEPAAPDAWSGAEAGKGLGEELKGVGQGIAGLFKGPVGVAGKALRAVAPIGDLMAVNDVTGSPLPMLAKAAGVDVPSSIGGVPVSQGSPSQLAMDLMGSPTARLNQVGSGISDAAQYVGDKATSAYDQFKNRLDSAQGTGTPYTPPAETSPNVAPWLNEAVNKQQTPPQTPAPDKAKFASSANKSEKAAENVQVRDKVFNQGPTANTTEGHPVGDAVTRLSALAQTDQAMNKTSDTGMGQGSILDSLYSKLKDSDVDYSDLAKRISQNEYDLARERKDGTLNAILGGVGAALSKAGSYEGVGDRVFRPGLGAIAGAGIMGGLKMSAASDEAIDKKSQDNMVAALALKKLKRESMNDVLDAISAQRQVDAIERGQDITAGTHKEANKVATAKVDVENRMADTAELSAKVDAMLKSAQARKLGIDITDAQDKMLFDSLNKQLGDYVNLLNGADKNLMLTPEQRQGFQSRLDGTQAQLNALFAKYGSNAPKLKPLGSGQYQGFKNLTDQ